MPPPLVYVCVTCDRHARPIPARSVGENLADTLRTYLSEHGAGLTVREVACLNGCLHPPNVAFRGPGRPGLRFSAVSVADIPALAALGERYWSDGVAGETLALPGELAAKRVLHVPASAGCVRSGLTGAVCT